MIDKIEFCDGYFNDIDKIEYKREPLNSPGEFKEIIKIYYKKKLFYLFTKTEKIELSSKEKAEKLMIKLTSLMNNTKELSELVV